VTIPSSPREKRALLGLLLAFTGVGGLAILHLSETLRIVTFCFLVIPGAFLFFGEIAIDVWNRSPFERWLQKSPEGYFWLRLAAVILWLGVIPLAIYGLAITYIGNFSDNGVTGHIASLLPAFRAGDEDRH